MDALLPCCRLHWTDKTYEFGYPYGAVNIPPGNSESSDDRPMGQWAAKRRSSLFSTHCQWPVPLVLYPSHLPGPTFSNISYVYVCWSAAQHSIQRWLGGTGISLLVDERGSETLDRFCPWTPCLSESRSALIPYAPFNGRSFSTAPYHRRRPSGFPTTATEPMVLS
jgi:hypothetical protein